MAGTTSKFTEWLRAVVTAGGFDLDKRGSVRAFAAAAGTDSGQTARALTGQIQRPSIDYLRAWTTCLRERGSNVTMRDMLIMSGWVTPDELPGPEVTVPNTKDMNLQSIAAAYGVPDESRDLFIASVQNVAKSFAEDPKRGTVGESQTGGLSAKR